jgi:hypothetical protein
VRYLSDGLCVIVKIGVMAVVVVITAIISLMVVSGTADSRILSTVSTYAYVTLLK